RVVQGGRFTARGRVTPDGRTGDATLKLTQLALTPAQPYVARSADVVLRSGEVSSTGKLTYRAGAESLSVTCTGSADVERLVVMEADIADPVLAWKSLHAEPIRFGLGPDRLEIDEVRVGDLDGRLVIFQDRTLNVARLMKLCATAQNTAPAPPPMSALQPKVFTDIAVIFRNVPMSTLSPYSATFAGRRIEAGTMNLDLEYKVDRSELQGENKVVLERFKLGARVESAGAMKLPLDL